MKRLLPIAVVALAACQKDQPYRGAFDEPVATAVVQPEIGGPFSDPIGYVANAHNGRIVPLSLKVGRFLTDDPHGSFLRSAPLPTGEARRLVSLATWAPDAETIQVFAGDARFGQLLRVPHVVGIGDDGFPVEAEASLVGDPAFLDVDASGDVASMTATRARTGFATTEDWSVSYGDGQWWVTGSRSGKQERTAVTGVPYTSDFGAIEFTITGTATAGDRFELSVDAGVEEIDLGGTPVALAMRPDQSVLAAIVEDSGTGAASLAWVDPVAGATVAGPALPNTSEPRRMTWSADGSTLWVADGGAPIAWEIHPDAGTTIAHALPWPIADVAVLDGDAGTMLYVVPSGESEVWIDTIGATPADDALVDVNAWVSGVQGLHLVAPITGIEAIPLQYRRLDGEGGVRRWGRSVGIALASGKIEFADEGTGCLTSDGIGPTTKIGSTGSTADYKTTVPSSVPGPTLAANADGVHHVVVNPCGGVARQESWSVTFDAAQQGWRVEGTLSGVQDGLAYEGQRYVSDNGAISFLIDAGSTPSLDGWKFSFDVTEGIVVSDGSNGATTRTIPLDVPSDPVFFHYRAGPQGTGWTSVDDRPFLLVAGEASDRVERIQPTDGKMEVDWQ